MGNLKSGAILLICLIALPVLSQGRKDKQSQNTKEFKNEIVMTPGMRISATTSIGTIAITAGQGLERSYTWEGATRSVEMIPRGARWYGSLGLYYPGPGDHWKEHNGITRCVVEEGEQHFASEKEALKWIHDRNWMPFVYTHTGLVVGWDKRVERGELDVEVWQIYIHGKKPARLAGSQDNKIVVAQRAKSTRKK